MANVLQIVIGGLIIAAMLGAILPTVADDTIGINTAATNISGAMYSLVSLIPLILVIGALIGILAMVGFRVVGKV